MLQSVYVARCVLHVLGLLLVIMALHEHAWNVIHINHGSAAVDNAVQPVMWHEHHHPHVAPTLTKLTFAPGDYCLHHRNGTVRCHGYAYLLSRIGDLAGSELTAYHDGNTSLTAKEVDVPLVSWCVVGAESSWYLQGAESMFCLVVLETCVYTSALLVGFSCLAVAYATANFASYRRSSVGSCSSFASYAAALLGLLLVVEWWGYSAYFMDLRQLSELSLTARLGLSFHLMAAATVMHGLAANVTAHLARDEATNAAQLHLQPPEQRNRRGGDSPRDEAHCVEEKDPLKCPANYNV